MDRTRSTGAAAVAVDPAPGRRLRILILTPSLPYPLVWGFGIRVYQFVRLLARRHDVTLLTYGEENDKDRVAAIESVGATVCTVPKGEAPGTRKRLAQAVSLFGTQSYQRRGLYSQAMQDALDGLSARRPFDVIQVESSQLAGFRFDPRSVLIVDEHNIEYELLYRMYQTERSVVRRFYNWLEYTKFRREEVGTWQSVAGSVTTSAREAKIIGELAPGKPAVVVPNAVDVEYFSPSSSVPNPDALVMTGLMHYRPNIDGALYFLDEIYPRILAVRPSMVFYIVGKGPPDELKQRAGPNVVVTDMVPDVREYAHKSSVFVVPLRMGGGTRLKVLEALSMEKPVVSTSLGSEGIDVVHGEHLLLADDPAAFASAVLQLLDDPARAARLARQGRLLVEQRYRWETVVERLEQFFVERLAGGGTPLRAAG